MSHKVIGDVRLQEVLEHPTTWALIAFTYYDSIPCRHFRPEFTKLSKHFAGKLYCAEINAQENPTITDTLKVIAVPTVLLIHKGMEINKFEGPYSSQALIERISKTLSR